MENRSFFFVIVNGLLVALLFFLACYYLIFPQMQTTTPSLFIKETDAQFEYVALGDSYTIGEGAGVKHSWPSQLVEELQLQSVDITLVANPSRTGYTTEDLVRYELPVLLASEANVVTIMIGVNDWVQGVESEIFERNIEFIFTEVSKKESVKHVFVISIPDFSLTPNGGLYTRGRNAQVGLTEFNSILEKQAQVFNYTYIDIFELSQNLAQDPLFISYDNLHYSEKGYGKFKDEIYPYIIKKLEK